MTGKHKYAPLRFRPPEPERLWLVEHAEKTGRPVNAILTAALSEYRERHDPASLVSSSSTPTPEED